MKSDTFYGVRFRALDTYWTWIHDGYEDGMMLYAFNWARYNPVCGQVEGYLQVGVAVERKTKNVEGRRRTKKMKDCCGKENGVEGRRKTKKMKGLSEKVFRKKK